MKLINLQITNLRKIKAAIFQFSLKGGVTKIVGKNENGKSTVLDAIMILLLGPKYMPEGSKTNGATEPTVISGEMDNGYVIKRTFTDKTDRIELNRILDGKMYPESSPQAFLDGVTSQIAIRPIAFLNKDAKEKSKIISKCLGITDQLADFAVKIKEYEESRAEVGKQIKAIGTLAEYDPALVTLKSVAEINKRLEDAKEYNATLRRIADKAFEEWSEEKRIHEAKEAKKPSVHMAITALKDKLEEMRTSFAYTVPETDSLISELQGVITNHLNIQKGAYLEVAYLVPTPDPVDKTKLIVIEDILKEMETITQDNAKIQKNIDLAGAIKDRDEKQGLYDRTQKTIETLRNNRAELITRSAKTVAFPFSLDIVDDNIHLDGITSENWSTSQGLLFALEACKLLNPALKTICIDDGEHFDEDRLQEVQKWAEENDFQTLITIVAKIQESDENTYLIEEGEITNTPILIDTMASQVPKKEPKPPREKASKVIEIPAEPNASKEVPTDAILGAVPTTNESDEPDDDW